MVPLLFSVLRARWPGGGDMARELPAVFPAEDELSAFSIRMSGNGVWERFGKGSEAGLLPAVTHHILAGAAQGRRNKRCPAVSRYGRPHSEPVRGCSPAPSPRGDGFNISVGLRDGIHQETVVLPCQAPQRPPKLPRERADLAPPEGSCPCTKLLLFTNYLPAFTSFT